MSEHDPPATGRVPRNRIIDGVIVMLAIALLAISFAPWWREIERQSHTTNAWHWSMTWAVTIVVIIGAAALWLLGIDRRLRVVAASTATAAMGWFLLYTWSRPATAMPHETAMMMANSIAARSSFAGFSYGPYLGSLAIVPLASIMVVAAAVDLARNAPRPEEWRRLAAAVPVLAAATLLAVSLGPWWHYESHTVNVWLSSTVWAGAVVATGLALGVWLRASGARARMAASVLAVGAAVTGVAYTITLPDAGPERRYYIYSTLSPGPIGGILDAPVTFPPPIRRDHLVAYPGTSGVDVGAYVGVALIVLIAAVMVLVTLGPAVARRARRRGDAR